VPAPINLLEAAAIDDPDVINLGDLISHHSS
jgi:hypothetical protein